MSDNPVEAIDHLLTFVHDLDAAARFFDALGFTLTPESRIDGMGIVNRLILFPETSGGSANFIELMSVSDPEKLPPAMARLLTGEEGIKSMVLSFADAARAHARLNALGCGFAPPVHVRREWKVSASESVWPEFDVLLPVDDVVTFNGCRYHNVELYRRPAWTDHRNGARAFDRVDCAAGDPLAAARRLADILDRPHETTTEGGRVTLGRVALQVSAEAPGTRQPGSAARFIGYRVAGASRDQVGAVLARQGAATATAGGALVVPGGLAFGQRIEFAA
ncbi:VOC family protein [Phreatobacter stygius]|uniref:VOC family protein n=1 Tax=Phreatobacter stygius TaxID=1940610 RepID=UPI001476C707|nr:VOC family protein [Phreatobacter stygius]